MKPTTGPTCQAFIQSRVDLFVSESASLPLPWTVDDWAFALAVVFIIVTCSLGVTS